MKGQKVILRFLDGKIIKGYADGFSPTDQSVSIVDESAKLQAVEMKDLKAIFFVKSFSGNKYFTERKSFAGSTPAGKKVFVRFKDGESMMGYIEGNVPWEKGFSLEHKKDGFFLIPVDGESNNIKVFVVSSSVSDVTSF